MPYICPNLALFCLTVEILISSRASFFNRLGVSKHTHSPCSSLRRINSRGFSLSKHLGTNMEYQNSEKQVCHDYFIRVMDEWFRHHFEEILRQKELELVMKWFTAALEGDANGTQNEVRWLLDRITGSDFVGCDSRGYSVSNRRRNICTTSPYNIWTVLMVLWGVCWMFYCTPHQEELVLPGLDDLAWADGVDFELSSKLFSACFVKHSNSYRRCGHDYDYYHISTIVIRVKFDNGTDPRLVARPSFSCVLRLAATSTGKYHRGGATIFIEFGDVGEEG